MHVYGRTIRVTVPCGCCGKTNNLTISDIANHYAVHCSTCRTRLGLIGDLVPALASPAIIGKAPELQYA